MTRKIAIIIIAVFSVFLTANLIQAQSTPLSELLRPECVRACWLGIEPGVTTQAELEQIFADNDIQYVRQTDYFVGTLLYSVSFPENDSSLFPYMGQWGWIGFNLDYKGILAGYLVDGIQMPVEDVVATLGSPRAIIDIADIVLVYEDKGLEFKVSRENRHMINLVSFGPPRDLTNVKLYEGCSEPILLCTLQTATPIAPSSTATETSTPSPTPTETPSPTVTSTQLPTATARDSRRRTASWVSPSVNISAISSRAVGRVQLWDDGAVTVCAGLR